MSMDVEMGRNIIGSNNSLALNGPGAFTRFLLLLFEGGNVPCKVKNSLVTARLAIG